MFPTAHFLSQVCWLSNLSTTVWSIKEGNFHQQPPLLPQNTHTSPFSNNLAVLLHPDITKCLIFHSKHLEWLGITGLPDFSLCTVVQKEHILETHPVSETYSVMNTRSRMKFRIPVLHYKRNIPSQETSRTDYLATSSTVKWLFGLKFNRHGKPIRISKG